MKKIYVSICALAISFSAIAQLSLENFTMGEKQKSHAATLFNTEKSSPFWSEDFSNGIPVTWSNSLAPWVYRGPSTTPNVSTGSQGAYGTNSGTISSPTASSGFLIFDSDYYDNNGIQGNFGNGPYPTPHNGDLKTDMIDLSLYPDVMVKLNSYFRTFQGQAFLRFYVNGVFDSEVEVHSDIDVNDSSPQDAVLLVRMPTSVPGNANVQIEFQFNGTDQSNANGMGYYFWMIDDIELIETPAYLADVIDVVHGGWNSTPVSQGFGMDYTMKPLIQSNANPYTFEMIMANIGANDLTGTQMNVEVYDGSNTQVFSSNSTPTTLTTLDTMVFVADQTYAPANTGLYEMVFWGSTDSILYTDSSYMQALITDTVYARDYGTPDGAWRVGRSCGGMQVGNIFDVYAADNLTSVSAHVADYSVAGANMFAVLYEVDTTASPMGFIFLDQTDDYTIQAADIDNWVTIPFLSPIPIDPQFGQQYMIAIGGYASPIDTFGISVSGDSEVTMSRIQDNGCNLGDQPFGYWYWISNTPMVRMNFGDGTTPPPTGLHEHNLERTLIKITDILGREVKENKIGPLLYIYDDGTVQKKIILE